MRQWAAAAFAQSRTTAEFMFNLNHFRTTDSETGSRKGGPGDVRGMENERFSLSLSLSGTPIFRRWFKKCISPRGKGTWLFWMALSRAGARPAQWLLATSAKPLADRLDGAMPRLSTCGGVWKWSTTLSDFDKTRWLAQSAVRGISESKSPNRKLEIQTRESARFDENTVHIDKGRRG